MDQFTKRLAFVLLLICSVCSIETAGSEEYNSSCISPNEYPHILRGERYGIKFKGFAKKYETIEEIHKRYDNYVRNLKKVERINKKKLSYTLAINEFADLSFEEFQSKRLVQGSSCYATRETRRGRRDERPLPVEKNWVREGFVTPVKDQGSCGSCWSFSAIGALESAYAKIFGNMVTLSEQQLVDCSSGFQNYGCGGGWPAQAFSYIRYSGGVESESTYPYTGKDDNCHFTLTNVAALVLDSVNITQGDEVYLQEAVAFNCPISVAFQVVDDFQLYNRGVFSTNKCGNTTWDLNHAIVAVGYGVEADTPYWLLKNSWGETGATEATLS